MHYSRHIHLVCKAGSSSQMLAKSVIGKQYFFFRAVGNHAVRPVEHRCRNEGKSTFSKGNAVASLYRYIIFFAIASGKPLETIRVAGNNLSIWALLSKEWNSTGMIWLNVIGYNIVYLCRIHQLADTAKGLHSKWSLYCINQGNLLVHDKVGIIGGAFFGIIAMKAAHGVIHRAYPIDALLDFCR